MGPLSYKVQCHRGCQGKKCLHVNDLHQWVAKSLLRAPAEGTPCYLQDPGELYEGELPWGEGPIPRNQPLMDEGLTLRQKGELEQLLRENPTVFSKRPGCTTLVEHAIHTPLGAVTRARWQPLPVKSREAVEWEVKEMLHLGVIKPSRNTWRSPVVLVLKPDGTIRFCIDYREVNKIAMFDAYPMPQVDILIGQLGHPQYLLALDLTKGYWQVPVQMQD